MSTADASSTQDDERPPREPRELRTRITYSVAAFAVAFVTWWIAAEAVTADGVDVRWDWNVAQWFGFVAILAGPAVLTAWTAPKLRRWSASQIKPDGETVALKWLVAGGLLVTLLLAALLFYWQAELLTTPGESAWSLESSELLDISRSAAFGLGAIGAIAVLLVGYRRQKSTEDAHDHQVKTTEANQELERRKQKAEEISHLHDRYAKAVEQLANTNPTIRLGGIYVLAALANDWLAMQDYRQRQVCVDMLCAYLRSVPEVADYVSDDKRDEQVLAMLKKDQDVRKAALESLSEIRTLEVGSGDRTKSRLAESVQDLYRAIKSPIPTARIDLRGITLGGLDLSRVRLAYLELMGADLTGTTLDGADLTRTNLKRAQMRGANLRNAELHRTNLAFAKMEGVELSGAFLVKTILTHTTITSHNRPPLGENLSRAILIGVHIAEGWEIAAQGVFVVMDKETLSYARRYMSAYPHQELDIQPPMPDETPPARYPRAIAKEGADKDEMTNEDELAGLIRRLPVPVKREDLAIIRTVVIRQRWSTNYPDEESNPDESG